jgi:hypothetical protein
LPLNLSGMNHIRPKWSMLKTSIGNADAHQGAGMGKTKHSTKEAKKQPQMSAKEKRVAKQLRKHVPDGNPIIIPH